MIEDRKQTNSWRNIRQLFKITKMKSRRLLLFFTFSFALFSNCSASSLIFVNSDSTRQYYNYIFAAEGFIMNEEFDSALFYYAKSLNTGISSLTNGININKCLMKAKDDNSKIQMFIYGYMHSDSDFTPIECIESASSYLTAKGVERLRDSIEYKQKIIDEINYQVLIEQLENMGANDQSFRVGSSFSKTNIRKRGKIDRINMRKLMKLYSKYGRFMTGKLYGGGFSSYRMILVHNFYNNKKYLKYNDFFIGEILAGRLDAREYAGIVDNYRFDSTQVYGCHTVFSVGDSLVVFQLSDSGKRKINSNRKSVFLQDIDVMQNKMIWQWRNFDSFWFENVWELIPAFSNETATDVAKQKLKEMGSIVTGYEILSR